MTVDVAAEKILAFLQKHPGLSHGDISRVLSMRRQDRQRAHRLLVASGRIVGTLRTDGKSLSWTPREPHRAEPVSEPRPDPISEAVTVFAPEAPFQPPAAVAAKSKSPFDMTAEEWAAAYGDPGELLTPGRGRP